MHARAMSQLKAAKGTQAEGRVLKEQARKVAAGINASLARNKTVSDLKGSIKQVPQSICSNHRLVYLSGVLSMSHVHWCAYLQVCLVSDRYSKRKICLVCVEWMFEVQQTVSTGITYVSKDCMHLVYYVFCPGNSISSDTL